MSPIPTFVYVTVHHAEYIDVNQGGRSAKFYRTYVADDGRVLFQYGRIGTVGQWVKKGNQGSAAPNVAAHQYQSKLNKGYEHVWRHAIRVPSEWMDMATSAHFLSDAAANQVDAIDGERPSSDTLGELERFAGKVRNIVAQMATDPDRATVAYAEAMPEYEALRESVELVEGYMTAIRDMLVAGAA